MSVGLSKNAAFHRSKVEFNRPAPDDIVTDLLYRYNE
jgi:hypothetical protein